MSELELVKETQFSSKVLSLEWLAAAVSNGFASAILNPMDVSKTRMQAAATSTGKTRLLQTFLGLYRENGLVGIWKPGLNASMAREFLYSGPRAGFYVPLRNFMERDLRLGSSVSKIAAALSTGIALSHSVID
jgi:hypothetical protein